MKGGGAVAEQKSRSARYEISTPIRYRIKGERQWRVGTTKNISVSGVLIRTEHSVAVNTEIEMKFALPVEISGEGAAEVVCRGIVVRSTDCPSNPGYMFVASKTDRARLLRQTG
jgi:PilZ domain